MEYHLHSNGKYAEQSMTESSHIEYEKIFAKTIANMMVEILDVNWHDKRIVEGLIFTSIHEHFTHRGKLLEQYLHTQLDIIANSLRSKFGISDNVLVNYDHAVHAKFNDLFEAIKHKYEDKP